MTTTIEPTLHPDALAHTRRAPDTRTEPDLLPPADDGVPIADPAPLGLAAFAGTTFVLSLFNAGLVGLAALVAVVLPLALHRFRWGCGSFATTTRSVRWRSPRSARPSSRRRLRRGRTVLPVFPNARR